MHTGRSRSGGGSADQRGLRAHQVQNLVRLAVVVLKSQPLLGNRGRGGGIRLGAKCRRAPRRRLCELEHASCPAGELGEADLGVRVVGGRHLQDELRGVDDLHVATQPREQLLELLLVQGAAGVRICLLKHLGRPVLFHSSRGLSPATLMSP